MDDTPRPRLTKKSIYRIIVAITIIIVISTFNRITMPIGFVKVSYTKTDFKGGICDYLTQVDIESIDKNFCHAFTSIKNPSLTKVPSELESSGPIANLEIEKNNKLLREALKDFNYSYLFVRNDEQRRLIENFVDENLTKIEVVE